MTSKEKDKQSGTAAVGLREVTISREPVELYKILKFENLVGSGAEAKAAVASGAVRVNSLVEIRKRRQIVSGDTIEFGSEKILIVFKAAAATSAPVLKTATTKKPTAANRRPIRIAQGQTKGSQ